MKTTTIKYGKKVRDLADQFAESLLIELSARWTSWKIDLSKKELHEVIGALLARQVTLAVEFARAPACWNQHVGPLFLRAMADVYISIAWILANPTKRLERAQMFIFFGLGQEKLQLEHRRAEIERDNRSPTDEERETLENIEAWINMQRYSFLTEVNVGSWSGITTRAMAEEAGCIDFYNYVYQLWSGATHSQWQHIGRFNVQQCGNPLHLNHLAPAAQSQYCQLHVLLLAAKYADRALQVFDSKIGLKVDVPSAFAELSQSLESLARGSVPTADTSNQGDAASS